MKKLFTSLACILAFVLLLSACGGNSASPSPSASPSASPEASPSPSAEPTPGETEELPLICQGIFEYTLNGGDQGQFQNLFHFYPNGIFYASQFNGSSFAAGYYEIKDETFDVTDPEDANKTITASQTIYMTLADGSEYETVGYDAENGKIGLVKSVYNNVFIQNKESEHTSADENGVAMTEYMLGEDEYSLLRFMHNGTFQDTIGAMVEGTWEKDGSVYTMIDAESGNSYTLTANDDDTGAYVALDGTSQTLNLVKPEVAQLTFRGGITATYGDMNVTIECYEGGKAVMVTAYGGRDTVTEGAWALASDYSKVTVTLDGNDYDAPLNPADQSFAFELTTNDGAADVTVPLTTAEGNAVEYTFAGETSALVIECYKDGTCALIYTGMGTIAEGTWTVDKGASPLPKWTLELGGEEVPVETDYATKFFVNYENTAYGLADVIALPFTALG